MCKIGEGAVTDGGGFLSPTLSRPSQLIVFRCSIGELSALLSKFNKATSEGNRCKSSLYQEFR